MEQFGVLEDAMRLQVLVRPVVAAIEKHDKKLADQLRRATMSVAANIAEGRNRRGGHQRERFGVAYGESHEVKSWLRMSEAWGYVPEGSTAEAADLADKVCACLWKCSRR